MKIILFIILALFVLLALAAIRYRKQINAIIGVGRMIRDARTGVRPQREIRASKTAAARELSRHVPKQRQ